MTNMLPPFYFSSGFQVKKVLPQPIPQDEYHKTIVVATCETEEGAEGFAEHLNQCVQAQAPALDWDSGGSDPVADVVEAANKLLSESF